MTSDFTRRTLSALQRHTGWLAMAGCVCLLAPWTLSLQEESPVGVTRTALKELVETRRLLAKERRDWQEGREILESRLGVVQDEITIMRDKIAQNRADISTADVRRDELTAENEALGAATADLDGVVSGLEARVRELLIQLPAPVQDTVRSFSQAIPEDSTKTELSLSRRFQNVIAVLEGVDKFHGEVQVGSEVLALGDGSSAEVATIYIGISQGYYVTTDGQTGGLGRPTPEGWKWEPRNSIAPQVAAALEILEGKQIASFISLPLQVEEVDQ